ncbi:hypothetical protein Saro_0969 [Novosphingobium aromaticivorans DSM 12444]|uniref:Uncharacterized protein n=1 Tax=Novosphingobium aromaticivorans (strain ATCC 700278 / DSM 12444 / CCUG 56034 / CIP 105152 / NBRC 16084 / F199) TaxID=279238 RepID=Q2G9Q9_NOVAD|nr:hypothetical protein [Novosphingobium aromaticivorans]ABD25414.1 hypothetical protein Saro_0969 [Novosphingobium aromaticivorans DSM 12444]SCX92796.1 hypothetical protein SAMN05660666_00299 [Novosphingobium aromaticivorans]
MRQASRLKGGGYLTSTISVVLLGIPALKSAQDDPFMLVCLLAGMILSVTGMAMRWRSHRTSQHRRDREIRTAALNLNENDSH